jgi:putative transcriptional regulator
MKAPRKEPPVKSLVLAVILAWSSLLHAADPSQPHILVAKPELRDNLYGASILVVKPIGGDQHVGFIVNRPTGIHLGKIFPEHGPSQKIVDPVYLGGPIEAGAIFALVRRADSPGGNSLEVLPGLYAAFEAPVVDRIIESEAERARFVAGLVLWQPGELENEIERGAWYVLEPDAETAMRRPEGLWEELVRTSAVRKEAI